MIEWWNTSFGDKDAIAAMDVVKTNYLNEGEKTREFEGALSDVLHAEFVHAVPNGTVAIAIALWAAGVKPHDEVIVPDLTFIATASAVHMVGAKPVLVDIDLSNFSMCIDDLYLKINDNTKAIVVVHVNGRAASINKLKEIRNKKNIPIIEDASQCLGSKYKDQQLGTIFDIGTMSLAPSKVISTGQGGLVLTNTPELSEMIVRLKDHGRLNRSEAYHPVPGYNFKFTDIQAAIGLEQLKELPQRLDKAKADYLSYASSIKDMPELKMIPLKHSRGEVSLWVDCLSQEKEKIINFLNNKEIYPQPFWKPLHQHWLNLPSSHFPNSTRISEQGFWLPSGPSLPNKDIDTVCREIRTCLGRN
jgi:perosamine synthetase